MTVQTQIGSAGPAFFRQLAGDWFLLPGSYSRPDFPRIALKGGISVTIGIHPQLMASQSAVPLPS